MLHTVNPAQHIFSAAGSTKLGGARIRIIPRTGLCTDSSMIPLVR